MENNELFKAIEQLKETLTEISSARQQVNDTVTAYAQTQSELHSYTENLASIENVLSNLIVLLQNNKVLIEQQSSSVVSNLKDSCDLVLSKTKDELSVISQKFAKDTIVNIDAMKGQLEKFNNVIEKTGKLTDKVDKISADIIQLVSSTTALQKDFVTSQAAQDMVIDNISRTQNSVSSQLKTINGTSKDIVVSLSKQENALEQQGEMLEVLSTCSNAISDNIIKLNTICVDIQNSAKLIQTNFHTSIEGVRKDLECAKQDIFQKIKNNQNISIIVLIVVIISIILQLVYS